MCRLYVRGDLWNKCTLFRLFNWSLESTGIRPMMEIPSCSSTSHFTEHHLCSASGFYSPDRLVHPISIPGIPQRLINIAHFPKDTVYSHIHDPGFLAYIPNEQSGSLRSPSLQLQRKCACQGKQLLPWQGNIQNTNTLWRRLLCVRLKSTDVKALALLCVLWAVFYQQLHILFTPSLCPLRV